MRFTPCLACVLAMSVCGMARGEAFRTLIMVDASSSMRWTDPQKLRKVAAELYVDLARDGDFVAIAQFDAKVKDVSGGFQKITGPEVRDRLKGAIRAISDDGDWTDFGAAFDAVGKAFAEVPLAPMSGEKRFLVFLTDGKCEPAPDEPRYLKEGEKPEKSRKAADEREVRCKQYVLAQALPELKSVETEIIGLSKSAPREYLEEVARRGGGRAVVTERAEDLPHLFAGIHAYNSGSKVAEATGNDLDIDKLVASLDLVVVAPKDIDLTLSRPDGSALPTDDKGLYVVRAERYRFFHIPKPATGKWTLKPSRKLPAGAIAAIQNYDLHLKLEVPESGTVGQPMPIKALLAAGEGGALPEPSFLARHKFYARLKVDGALKEIVLTESADGARVGQFTPEKAGSLEVSARVEPGPDGALTRVTTPVTVQVVPPLKIAWAAPFKLGELKPGAKIEKHLDLTGSEFMGEVRLDVSTEGMKLEARPTKLILKVDEKRFDVSFEVPSDAAPGPVAGALVLTPATKPYLGRAGARVPVEATILPLSFWEKHGGKVIFATLLLILVVAVVGFKTPARFPKKLRVWYQDKPNQDDGDFGLWLRGKPGFFKPATLKVGGGGPIRRSSPLYCEIVAAKDGVLVRPAKGRSLKAGGDTFSAEFRPTQGVKYEVDEGLIIWIGKEEEE
jgi:hypothetical protein